MRGALRFARSAIEGALLALLVAVVSVLALPHVSQYDVRVVSGGSMEPAIHLGSVVVVDRADRVPQVGAVVTFRDTTEGIVTHRVVALEPASFQTKGDANNSIDVTPRSTSDVIGTVRFSIPYLGYLLYVLQQPIVFFGVLIAALGVLILGQVHAIGDEVRTIRHRRAAPVVVSGEEPTADAS